MAFGSERGLVAHIAKKHIAEPKANGLSLRRTSARKKKKKVRMPPGQNIEELKEERKLIEVFLAALEHDYIQGKVSLRSYEEAKKKNLARLEQIEAILEELEKEHKDEKSTIKSGEVVDLPRKKKGADEDRPIGEIIQEELQRELEEQKKEEMKKKEKEKASESAETGEPAGAQAEGVTEAPPGQTAETAVAATSEEVAPPATPEDKERKIALPSPRAINLPKIFGRKEEPSDFLKKLDEINLSFTKQIEGLKAEIEKLSAKIDTEKEAREALSQRLQSMAEEIGEMRAIVRQRELALSKQEAEFEKMRELINEIKPEKVVAQFTKMEAEIVKNQSRIEKLETLMSDLIEKVKKVYDVLQDVGHIENLLELTKKMEEKKTRMEQVERNVESISKKIEHTLVDLNTRLENVDNLSRKVTTLEEMINSLSTSIEDLNKRLFDYAEKAETSMMREEINDVKKSISALKESVEELRARILAMKTTAPAVTESTVKSEFAKPTEVSTETLELGQQNMEKLKQLQEEKNEIMLLLTMLDEEYKKGTLSEDEYLKAKKLNQVKLEEIESQIKALTTPSAKLAREASPPETLSGPRPTAEATTEPAETEKAKNEAPHVSLSGPALVVEKPVELSAEKPAESVSTAKPLEGSVTLSAPSAESKATALTQKSESVAKETIDTMVKKETVTEEPKPEEKSTAPTSEEAQKEDTKTKLLRDLEDMYKKGMISQDAYERTKKRILAMKV